MADTKGPQILKRITVPKFLVPAKVLRALEVSLANAHIAFSATEWLSIFVFIGTALFIVASLLFSPLAGVGLFIGIIALMFMYPQSQAGKRRAQVEEVLPDALHHMSVAVKTGLVLESVIKEVSEAGYGVLSEEFAQVVVEMNRGRSLRDALLGFSTRVGSRDVKRTMRLLLEGVEFGGPISEVLDEVSEDMRATRAVMRERKTLTSQQISFLALASLFAGPFVMGVVAAIPTIMETMIGSGAEAAMFPLDEIAKVVTALTFYVVGQAMSAGIMMGVIMFGDFKKGFKFMVPMGLIAFIVYSATKMIMPSAMAIF